MWVILMVYACKRALIFCIYYRKCHIYQPYFETKCHLYTINCFLFSPLIILLSILKVSASQLGAL